MKRRLTMGLKYVDFVVLQNDANEQAHNTRGTSRHSSELAHRGWPISRPSQVTEIVAEIRFHHSFDSDLRRNSS